MYVIYVITFQYVLQTNDVDLDEAVSTVEQSAPYLVITGAPGSINCQLFIGCEQEIFLSQIVLKIP